MSTREKRFNFTVQLGFTLILILIVLLISIFFVEILKSKSSIVKIVEENNVKIELATNMREAIRLRQFALFAMLATDDPFERDKELLNFYDYSGMYRRAREKLINLPLNQRERNIHAKLSELTRLAQPINRQAAEDLHTGKEIAEIRPIMAEAHLKQRKLLALLDELVGLQKQYGITAVSQVRSDQEYAVKIVTILGGLVVLITLLIARFEYKFVSSNNRKLVEAYEKAAEATRAKSDFLANMSHEIRTPITTILGYAESALDDDLPARRRAEINNVIIRSSNHLQQLVNDILDLSKIEAGKLEVEHITTSPAKLMADIENTFKKTAGDKGLEFSVDYRFPLPSTIYTDPTRISQILMNLCSNAIKFTDSGFVRITLRYDQATQELIFVVEDSGIGVSNDKLATIFEPFTQADNSITRNFGGTGLGLSLARHLAQLLGGKLTAKSEKGQGSRFCLHLFAQVPQNNPLLHHITELPRAGLELKPLNKLNGTVLLAEDHPENRMLFIHFLKKFGVKVIAVDDGEKAVQTALTGIFDAVLMDMQMPVMCGVEATKAIRRQGNTVPIIALTANAFKEDRDRCIEAGCDDFLAKPIQRESLYSVLNKYISHTQCPEPAPSNRANEDTEMTEIINAFVSDLKNHTAQLESLAQGENWEILGKLVHDIKGQGSSFGFPELSEMAERIHIRLRQGQTEDIHAELSSLIELCHDISRGERRPEILPA